MSAKKTYIYPIFTFRWLAVHALAVPTIFFIGSITAMQFIVRLIIYYIVLVLKIRKKNIIILFLILIYGKTKSKYTKCRIESN